MSSPSQTRDSRVKCLVSIARAFLEAGVPSHVLASKLERASWRLWPALRDKTRREYITAALRTVLMSSQIGSGVPEAVETPQEALS